MWKTQKKTIFILFLLHLNTHRKAGFFCRLFTEYYKIFQASKMHEKYFKVIQL
jgi:hypothetical protein